MARMMQNTKKNHSSVSPALFKLNIAFVLFFTFTCSFTFLSGCAAPIQKAKKRYFFPPPPDTPRVEWLARYRSQHDLPKTDAQRFKESITGQEEAKTFNKPWGVASNGEDKVYVADSDGPAVIVFDMKENTVKELGGEQYEGMFQAPMDIDIDSAGNLYVSDSKKKMVFVFTSDEKPLKTIGGPEMKNPSGITVDRRLNRLYVANPREHNILAYDLATGNLILNIGKRGDGDGEFNFPTDVAVDSKGNIIVADSMNARVQILDKDGNFIRKFGRRGDTLSDFQMIKSVAVSRDDYIFLTEARMNRVMVFNEEGQSLLNFGVEDNRGEFIGGFNLPMGIYIDKNERLYAVDSLNKRFHVFQIINEEWLKKYPIREGEQAEAVDVLELEKKKKKEKEKGR